ncbi:MAG: hypothetical protein QOE68_3209 [Thermoanaerobaculia bacterium]|jgi:hypothetical protein|nr:hypothetical protein [Thermoanaerobaculia bacterium]
MADKIFSIQASAKANALAVKEVGSSTAIAKGFTNLQSIVINGKTYIMGLGKANIDLWEFTPKAPFLKPVAQKLKVGAGQTLATAFTIGNQAAVVSYEPKKGQMHFYAINGDLTVSENPYIYYRNHEPGLTQGFTTLKQFSVFGGVTFIGYRGDNGYVAMYSLGVGASTPPKAGGGLAGAPPYIMTPQWSHVWAPGWTRFAFFQMGGENFFLKTNTMKPNVNIDHVTDGLTTGTVEVGTELDPAKVFQKYVDQQAFTLANGDPYFVTVNSGGAMTFNHFNADCLGWTQVATASAQSGASQLIPISGEKAFLIVH